MWPRNKDKIGKCRRALQQTVAIVEKSDNQQQAESAVDPDINMANRHIRCRELDPQKELRETWKHLKCNAIGEFSVFHKHTM